jgi:uracil-DNA glycosylase
MAPSIRRRRATSWCRGSTSISTEARRLLAEARGCRTCAAHLPLGPKPIVQIGTHARILIASQAPGRRAHVSGVPFADRAGDTLCRWLGVDRAVFHDPEVVAILPIGLCYPGRGPGGDLPPRPECAPRWHARLRALMPVVRLTVVLGRHAQAHHLGARCKPTLAATVEAFRDYLPDYFPLPHPSPRNTPWLVRHPWFVRDVLPALRAEVARALR